MRVDALPVQSEQLFIDGGGAVTKMNVLKSLHPPSAKVVHVEVAFLKLLG